MQFEQVADGVEDKSANIFTLDTNLRGGAEIKKGDFDEIYKRRWKKEWQDEWKYIADNSFKIVWWILFKLQVLIHVY